MNDDATRPTLLARLTDLRDEEAWDEFDACYRGLILGYCRARGLQHWDAEDVRQIVMLSLSRAFQSFRYDPSRGLFRHYLGRVVRNAIARHLARPASAIRCVDDEVLAALADAPAESDDGWEREWRSHHLRLAMSHLRRGARMRDVEIFDALLAGETVTQVAPRFGMSDQAVQKVKQRVRSRLHALVTAQIQAEDAVAV